MLQLRLWLPIWSSLFCDLFGNVPFYLDRIISKQRTEGLIKFSEDVVYDSMNK